MSFLTDPAPHPRMSEFAPASQDDSRVPTALRDSTLDHGERRICAMPQPAASTDPAVIYDACFDVVVADTPALLDAVHALRYQVYCVENTFLNPAEQANERECDRFDAHSVHAALVYKPTGGVVGCVRLILPGRERGLAALPIHELLSAEMRARLDRCDPVRTAEISRYALSRAFLQREIRARNSGLGVVTAGNAHHLVRYLSLGLFRGVARLAAKQGITTICAAMTPALLRLLQRSGVAFETLGSPVDHHGLRQPCIADGEALLTRMAQRNSDIHRPVETAYRGSANEFPQRKAARAPAPRGTDSSRRLPGRNRPASSQPGSPQPGPPGRTAISLETRKKS